MDDKIWQRVKELFDEASTLPGRERAAFLERECAGDDAILERVQSLLKAHAEADEFLREPTVGADVDATSDSISAEPGMSIGPYRLLERIGEGGFGVVYMAEQRTPIARRVALKIIKPGMDTKQVIARFDAERQALAMMDHPNIARVFDAGETPLSGGGGGRPYFVMELVKGVPITQYCDQNALTIPERLELFATACEAVQHAHQKGIIHRDLKPSNVLVTMRDGLPIVKVIDFGIAKATKSGGGGRGPRLTDKTLFTEFHQLIGTPQYMSPEQASSELDIDTRSDIYSLGVLLYELLTGTTPFDPERLRSAALAEIQRIIREEESQKPSTRLSTLAALPSVATHRRTDSATLSRSLRGELDWIVMKTLEKDRTRRYATATDLAADVQRYLRHEPVTAGPPSRAYRVRKFVRRNRPAVAAASLVAVTLILGFIGTSVALAWALHEAERAHLAETADRERADELEKVADFQASQLSEIDVPMMGVRLRRDLIEKRQAALERIGRDEDEIARGLEGLERSLAGINFTDVALATLDENIFERALAAIEEQFADQPLLKARLLQTLAVTMLELGLLGSAVMPQTEALEIRRAVLGEEHLLTLNSMHAQGALMRMMGRFDDAEAILRRAVDGSRRVLGEDHPDTLDSMNTLAVVLVAMDRFDDAEEWYNEVLAGRRRVLGDEHPDTILIMGNMGSLFKSQGRFVDAEAYLADALEGSRRHYGEDDFRTLAFRWHMGQVLLDQQRLADAEPHLRSALDGSRRVLGDGHRLTVLAKGTLARLLMEQGLFADAELLMLETYNMLRNELGPTFTDTLITHRRIIALYEAWHDAEPAGGYADKARTWEVLLPAEEK